MTLKLKLSMAKKNLARIKPKVTVKEEIKEPKKIIPQEEIKEEPKEEVKEEPKEEVKEEVKEEPKVRDLSREKISRYIKGAVNLFTDIKGITFPKDYKEHVRKLKEDVSLKDVNETYPLIKLKFGNKEITFAYAHIYWDVKEHNLIYEVVEPKLNKDEKNVLEEIKNHLQDKLDVSVGKIKTEKAYEYILKKFNNLTKELGYKLTRVQKAKFQYYLYRDFIGLERIEPLLHDGQIEDISCDGVNVPVFIYHRNPKFGDLKTNIKFTSTDELDSFVLKLAQKCGRSLSIAQPLLDGSLPDGSRVQATFGTDIARRGSNFTIRKFTKDPLTPIDLINFGTADEKVMAYLWLAVENKLSILVAGATATGKTSFLNALSLFIKPELKVISIEDTPELRLPLPNWIPQVARAGFGHGNYGEVSMFDLLKSALRQRPDYVIVGEVRGKEAYVMFQGMSTGHAGLGTLHADSVAAVIDRLTTKPIDLPKAMLENLDIIVFLILTKRENEYIRRVSNVEEVIGFDYQTKNIITNQVFKWDPFKDIFIPFESAIVNKVREKMGLSLEELKNNIDEKVAILKWMRKKKIRNYKDVAKIINLYYSNKKMLIKMIRK